MNRYTVRLAGPRDPSLGPDEVTVDADGYSISQDGKLLVASAGDLVLSVAAGAWVFIRKDVTEG